MAIDTSKVQGRRKVEYASLQAVLADAERMSAGEQNRILHRCSGEDAMSMGTKKARENFQGCLVIFDDQEPQRIGLGFWLYDW